MVFLQDILTYWGRISHDDADRALCDWGHWLGAANRPFGRQSFGLLLGDALVSVAVSESTVNGRFACFDRKELVELTRLCAAPEHRDMTRVCLRLWRKTAAEEWSRAFWPVEVYASYSDSTRHKGDIYRFDGWTLWDHVRGGSKSGGWQRAKKWNPKKTWVYALSEEAARRIEKTKKMAPRQPSRAEKA